MVVGEIAEQVDMLVIGGGPGGYAAALRGAQLGRSVTLVERGGAQGLGGTCLQVGCIPSKSLIELAGVVGRLRALEAAGLRCEGSTVDLARFQEWRRQVVGGLTAGLRQLMDRRGVRVIEGEARFSRPDRVVVATPDGNASYLELHQAVIATGSRPAVLPGLEPDGVRVLDSTGALALERIPASVAVVGAGYIGLELGMALAKLGSRVSFVEACDTILPGFEEALTRPVTRRLRDLGAGLLLGSSVLGLSDDGLEVQTPDGRQSLAVEVTILAVGRRPNTDGLGLQVAGVPVGEDGLIPVGEDRRASATIAAVGDIVAGPSLAHSAMREGVVAAEALSGRSAAFEPAAIPEVVFTDPEIASVGYDEAQARAAGMEPAVSTFPLTALGRAVTMGGEGLARLVVDRGTDSIVGVHLVGPHASELIAEATLAIEMAASPGDLGATIHPHPTLSEQLGEVAELFEGRPLHVLG